MQPMPAHDGFPMTNLIKDTGLAAAALLVAALAKGTSSDGKAALNQYPTKKPPALEREEDVAFYPGLKMKRIAGDIPLIRGTGRS
jgi:hypothetical protein